jgi:hypothetical protein
MRAAVQVAAEALAEDKRPSGRELVVLSHTGIRPGHYLQLPRELRARTEPKAFARG